ncbi:ATP-binding protein [Botrimarina mediterranea]|uniref:ATP-binding protein n=1 Tax=Botrimarina mediterranea TaxID=2528022 RepID=UPI00118B535D|nr:AAA-like domain protein [Planctomycetes bacterium K2D]
MPLFEYEDNEALGTVRAVDTATVAVAVDNVELLRKLQVNRLVALQSSKPGQHLIGIVQKITRDAAIAAALSDKMQDEDVPTEQNTVRITLIGTFIARLGTTDNIFRRTLETVPEIDARCFAIEGEHLTGFMRATSFVGSEDGQRLTLGSYTLDEDAEAFLNANRFFQRHAVVVGSTGSGKSWTTARLLEQVATLPHANAILFDIHGEYKTLSGDGIRHFRIAGSGDLGSSKSFNEGVLYFPYWLLSYEEMTSMLVDRSDQNAPNQAMVLSRTVTAAKRAYLEDGKHEDILRNFTIDSPVPYDIGKVLEDLRELDVEMVKGSSGRDKQGEFHGRLSRFIARLENKLNDRRLGFMLAAPAETSEFDWLSQCGKLLLAGTRDQETGAGGVKVIDFSEVPSDILPLILGRFASFLFQVQQWTPRKHRHPIAIFCDEAHLYIPHRSDGGSVSDIALNAFERIAKEGRKYGVGLVVISQRPSEVSRTVLSQCNNFVALRLTNAEDQNVVQRLLPDSLGGLASLLPVLDTGEALVVGDASLLPSRIRISEPQSKPDSGTVDFWDEWCRDGEVEAIANAVHSWRRQSFA